MAASNTLNNSCELNITPSRKRKRQFHQFEEQENENDVLKRTAATTSCFTNAGFSSTPKKVLGKRRIRVPLAKNKDNNQIFSNIGLEVKSVADIVKQEEKPITAKHNPYEVLRKPPKKKKRCTDETTCFENLALNLELPEKQFNPYEVVREVSCNKANNCFSNRALNLKVQDASSVCNPFEVPREPNTGSSVAIINPFAITTENDKQSEVYTPKTCNLKLGLPFVPTVGCRIDFKNISMSQLTPSKLLAEKLVFSPVPKAKISLGSIGEETTMDIGKELDRYQLELENSINEAKSRKNGMNENDKVLFSPSGIQYQIKVVDVEKNRKFIQTLMGISEDGESKASIDEDAKQKECHIEIHKQKESVPVITKEKVNSNPFLYEINNTLEKTETAEVIGIENLNDLYGYTEDDQEGEENSFDFKIPAPFVRTYTKPVEVPKLMVSKESLVIDKSDKTVETDDHKKSVNVKNIIRKSIRKLMHSHQQAGTEDDLRNNSEHEKPNGLLNAIRQSLRRKSGKNISENESVSKKCEISIIDDTERTMKLKSDLETEYLRVEDLTNEKKHNIRNSIRKSTREVRNQFMKSVFNKKHEEYNFNKS